MNDLVKSKWIWRVSGWKFSVFSTSRKKNENSENIVLAMKPNSEWDETRHIINKFLTHWTDFSATKKLCGDIWMFFVLFIVDVFGGNDFRSRRNFACLASVLDQCPSTLRVKDKNWTCGCSSVWENELWTNKWKKIQCEYEIRQRERIESHRRCGSL